MWSSVCRFHLIRYVGGADLWSTSLIVPVQPPSGMSGKSGSVVPGFTRTCTPVANRAGVRGFFSFLFFLTMTGPPLSLPVILQEKRRAGQGPAGCSWWQARTARPTAAGYHNSMTIRFLHGWQSVPAGVKPTFPAQHRPTVLNPKHPDG